MTLPGERRGNWTMTKTDTAVIRFTVKAVGLGLLALFMLVPLKGLLTLVVSAQ